MSAKKAERTYEEIYREYRGRREKIEKMGGDKAVQKQHAESKLTARERLEYFFDQGIFTEIGCFVEHRTTAFGLGEKDIPAEGVVVGFGKVNGRYVIAAAEDYTTMAGTFGEYHGKKFSEAIRMAKEKGVPFVGLNDSGGARLQEGMDTLQSYAWLFRAQILASGIIPQIAVIMGPCLGGQAYHPIMQDFLIQCKTTGFMGIAGPAFVKTQLGEEISLEKLCGVRAHAVTSGQTHLTAEDDRDALDKAKRILSFLPSNNRENPPVTDTDDDPERVVNELDEMLPVQPSTPFDMHKVIERIVDNGDFLELFPDFARNVIIGFARFHGRPTGIVASQPDCLGGVINCDAADKIARFVRFCDLYNLPLVNLHDTPGFMIGSREEHKGILRHGAKMLFAYIDATVPKITVILRKSFAGAYIAMCCKDTGADLVYAWPNARISIVGAETAASVIFAREIKESADPARVKEERI
ncbi:MAG: acyl-CoA carboxylase subunit beta, partial [Syntrophales bacterium]|nr:acyl-CoA carboxylase subunit beta [Syntrophales bacterium]